MSLIEVPEDLVGIATERSAMTGVLVAEAMAHGDMGQAVGRVPRAGGRQYGDLVVG
ncbi:MULTISPECIES: hypothetical protein [Kribbella]|uniref:hypothetical protein n=1 Tax=Kribbella TaxID=182639 RepID=UPI001F5466F1|nr:MULTISPECIES: hypothetical protein [Kribbella]